MTSKYHDLYKLRTPIDVQSTRRTNLLEKQKSKRNNELDDIRGIQDLVKEIVKKTDKSTTYQYKNILQQSEWLKDRPESMSDWFLVPCPKGQRCLVITTSGRTSVYSKSGRFMWTFRSNYFRHASREATTVLDCFYNVTDKTFYVLDVLSYGLHNLQNCDTAFRFFWLTGRLQEDIDSVESSEFSFVPIRYYDCSDESEITECLTTYPMWPNNVPELDGLLFYHKESIYIHGTTPLVLWLFPWMVGDVLDWNTAHTAYIMDKPKDYVDYQTYIKEFDEQMVQRRNRSRKSERMDTTPITVSDEIVSLEMLDETIDDQFYNNEIM